MTCFIGRLGLCLGLFLGATVGHATTSAETVSFTTLNIRWYGLNGDAVGRLGSETRDETIRNHLVEHDLLTDVISFQEIVDVPRLKKLLGKAYDCQSYDHENSRHQHVVVCVKAPLKFLQAEDDNYAFEDVSLRHHRPAVHGWVTSSRGRKLLHFVAVHLKAMPDKTEIRLTQAEIIGDALAGMDTKLPTMITGDFNTYNDEAEQIQAKFAERGVDLEEQPTHEAYTFRSTQYQNKFDRVYSSQLKYTVPPHVVGPCNGNPTREELKDYYQNVSDHCAVTWSVQVPSQR